MSHCSILIERRKRARGTIRQRGQVVVESEVAKRAERGRLGTRRHGREAQESVAAAEIDGLAGDSAVKQAAKLRTGF